MRTWSIIAGAATLVTVALVMSELLPAAGTRLVADLTGLVGAFAASIAFGITAHRYRQPWRWWLATALSLWGVGQALWTGHRVAGQAMTFPNVENIFFFGLPVFALIALVRAARQERSRHREDVVSPRRVIVLDGVIIVSSLAALLWEITLGSAPPVSNLPAFLWAVSYTVGDLVFIVVTILLAVALDSLRRIPLAWLMLGLIAIGVSDVAYTFAISRDVDPPPIADIGYMSGPVLLLVAATVADKERTSTSPSLPLLFLPYVPLAAVIIMRVGTAATGIQTSAVDNYLLGLVVGLVVFRQMLTLQQLYSAHENLHHQATHDDLTGLANRALVLEYLAAALTRARRRHYRIGLVYVDLDRFKQINDELGHAAGDTLLRTCADRLRRCIRGTDLLGRIGGDEFVIILEPVPPSMETFSERLRATLAAPFWIGTRRFQEIAASVGHVLVTGHDTPAGALARADEAMYRAKNAKSDE